MPVKLRSDAELRRYGDLVIVVFVLFVIGLFMGFGLGFGVASENRSVAIQMYVMSVDEGADLERYAIEQAGDQFTYQLSEDVMSAIQSTPYSHECVDGLAITSVWTSYADKVSCDGPVIHVVLIAP